MATRQRHASSVSYDFGHGEHIINLDGDDDDGYESDSTLKGDDFDQDATTVLPTPDPECNAIYRDIPTVTISGSTLRAGKVVELVDGDFLQITLIVEHRISKERTLRGVRFRRNSLLDGLLEKKTNEVTLLLHQNRERDQAQAQASRRPSTESVSPERFVRVRQLIKTNQHYPNLSYEKAPRSMGQAWNYEHGSLTCRWQYLDLGKNQGILKSLTKGQCDQEHYFDEEVLRFAFRGETRKGGLCPAWSSGEVRYNRRERERCHYKDPLDFFKPGRATADVVDLTIGDDDGIRRYTLGDGFCGAGGCSRGAKGAGLRIVWGFDFDTAAIESFSMNFAGAKCWAIAAHDFIITVREYLKVDILHLSPPCQTFSPAHTRPGKDDEMNQATFLATAELIRRAKPRVVTLEETFGLTRTAENLDWFKAMVRMFISLNFSVRWKVFDLREYGLPQPRKRLFLFASCPGEPLPDFPEPTHCEPEKLHLHPGRKPYVTVNQAISDIPRGVSLHNPDQAQLIREQPYNGNEPLKNTITCGTGAGYHPSGRRLFTLREIALLQGFPLEHEFGSIRVRKQIGNAVPPIVAKVFFEQIIKSLRKADGLD